MDFQLTGSEKAMLLETARESITSQLEQREGSYPLPGKKLKTPLGAFVTLHLHGNLRGCIGHIIPVYPLFTGIRYLARESAFRDPRFPALTLSELPETDIEISVLSPMERISTVDVIQVGTHGILLQKGGRSGVLLPQVPVEQGWNLQDFLTNTCYKAGLRGDCWKDKDTSIEIFSALVFGEKS